MGIIEILNQHIAFLISTSIFKFQLFDFQLLQFHFYILQMLDVNRLFGQNTFHLYITNSILSFYSIMIFLITIKFNCFNLSNSLFILYRYKYGILKSYRSSLVFITFIFTYFILLLFISFKIGNKYYLSTV